jgi:endonuclease III
MPTNTDNSLPSKFVVFNLTVEDIQNAAKRALKRELTANEIIEVSETITRDISWHNTLSKVIHEKFSIYDAVNQPLLKKLTDKLITDAQASEIESIKVTQKIRSGKYNQVPIGGPGMTKAANDLVTDLDRTPHAYVIACIADKQVRYEKAWNLPYELKCRLGFFDFERLAKLKKHDIEKAVIQPSPLHRYKIKIALEIYEALQRIKTQYSGNAALIWNDNPSSETLVNRFLEFKGIGPKIASMAADILVSYFGIPVRDTHKIDIPADRHVRRVLTRMGFVPENTSNEGIVSVARNLYSKYPGMIDHIIFPLGREICKPNNPDCLNCEYSEYCQYHAERRGANYK